MVGLMVRRMAVLVIVATFGVLSMLGMMRGRMECAGTEVLLVRQVNRHVDQAQDER